MSDQSSIQNLSNVELLAKTKLLANEERKLNIEILKHLKEIELRKLFLEIGYRSLFEYTVKELSFSEDSAYRRINAMRLLKDLPQVEEKIENGRLSLTAACKVQNFFKSQVLQNKIDFIKPANHKAEQSATNHSQVDKLKLIESIENKSTREVERELLKLNPELVPTEKVRPITENKTEIKLVVDDELKNKLDQLKNLLSHVNPNMSYQELIARLAEIGLDKLDPVRKANRKANQKAEVQATKKNGVANFETTKKDGLAKNSLAKTYTHSQRDVSGAKRVNSRYVSPSTKQAVWVRDGGQCTYNDKATGRRCSSSHLLQFDHIHPFRFGGVASAQNLRLLCQQHNNWRNTTERIR